MKKSTYSNRNTTQRSERVRHRKSTVPVQDYTSKQGSILTWEIAGMTITRDLKESTIEMSRDGEVVSTLSTTEAYSMGKKLCADNDKSSEYYTWGAVLCSASLWKPSP